MANRQLDFKIIQVIKTTAEWATWEAAELSAGRTGIITQGILCCEKMTDNCVQVKVGDGTHKYSELGYITDHAISHLGNVVTIKGVVQSYDDLPSTGNKPGDVYFVSTAEQSGSDIYEEYIWTTTGKWEFIGKTGEVVIPAYTGGTGISVVDGADSKVINHTNSITAQATTVLAKISYDAQGHITGKATVTASDLIGTSDTPIIIDGTYNASTNKVATQSTVDTAITDATATAASQTTKLATVGLVSDIVGTAIGAIPDATTTASGLMSASDKTKLNGIATGAEVNQNAFSNVKVGSTTIAASAKTDTIELVGDGVTITPDATNKKITIASNATAVSVTDTVNTGDTIATITVDATPYTIKNNVQTTAIATDSGTPSVSLAANSTYKLTAGNSSVVFKTPADTTYTGGDCITITNGAINHDAPATAPTGGFKKVTLDTYGHVTATSAVAWSDITGISNNKASSSQLGLVKLSSSGNISIDSNGVISVTSDNALSDSSTNPVQNAVVTSALVDKLDVNDSYVITCIL